MDDDLHKTKSICNSFMGNMIIVHALHSLSNENDKYNCQKYADYVLGCNDSINEVAGK